MKAEENKHVVLSNAMGEDMISKLPDSLISQMLLLCLPTKEAVKTSVLSTRWKRLWLFLPALDLDTNLFPDYNTFVSFMDKFLEFSKEHKSCLDKLKLSIRKDENDDRPCVAPWIDFFATSKLRYLDVECLLLNRHRYEVMPLSVYVCKRLHYLRLNRVYLGSFDSVSLPCVKTMRLEENVYANEATISLLISSCPVLEDLGIGRRADDNVKFLRVYSQTLISLAIEGLYYDQEDEDFDFANSGIIIDAPILEYLNFDGDSSECKIITNSASLTKVILDGDVYLEDSVGDIDYQKRDIVRNFFKSISGVRDMNISWMVFEFIEATMVSLPTFRNLSCLEAEVYFDSVKHLPKFLESYPNLRSLILELLLCSVTEQTRLSFVPQCLLSSLESVEIKGTFNKKEEFKLQLKLARYFAKNSAIFRKIIVHSTYLTQEKNSAVLRAFLALPRQSSTCEIIVCSP